MPYSSLPSPAHEDDFEDPTTDIVPVVARAREPTERGRLTLFALLGAHGKTVLTIDRSPTVVGRSRKADVMIADAGLSRRHLKLYRDGDDWFIQDLQSRNGTFLDDTRVNAPVELKDGMRLLIGGTCLFRVGLSDALEQAATVRMYESSVLDPLTRVHNRRYLDDRLEAELAYARRHGAALSLLLLDIDHFKKVNDTLGHQAGDAVLRVLGGALSRFSRTEDVVARFGGEEFAIVARGIDARNARILGDRVRRLVSSLALPWAGETIRFTTSVGIASLGRRTPYDSVASLVAAADGALYRAKHDGRNRCRSAQESGRPDR